MRANFLPLLLALLLFFSPATRAGGDFNGTTGYYELASNLGFAGDADFPITVMALVRPDTVSGSDTVFAIDDKGDINRASIALSAGIPRTEVVVSGGGATVLSTSKTATAGRWYWVAAILDDTATATFVWVDGSFLGGGSGTTRALADLDTTAIGCCYLGTSAPTQFFDGGIARVAVWNFALSEEQMQGVVQGRDPRRVRGASGGKCVLYVPRLTGTACHDVVGNRSFTKNGTIADTVDEPPMTGFKKPCLDGWTPASLTGVVAWLKGDAGVTGSAPVTAWADQSGSGNDLDNTGTGAPALVATGYGGKNGVAFTSDSLYGEPAPVTAAPIYVLMVAKTGSTANPSNTVWVGDKDLDTEGWLPAFLAGGQAVWAANALSVAGSSDTASCAGGTVEDSVTRSVESDELATGSPARRVSTNGGQQGTNTGSNSPAGADRFSVGRREDATPDGEAGDFTLYELVIFTTAPTDAERIKWFRYVEARWGVSGGPWRYQ